MWVSHYLNRTHTRDTLNINALSTLSSSLCRTSKSPHTPPTTNTIAKSITNYKISLADLMSAMQIWNHYWPIKTCSTTIIRGYFTNERRYIPHKAIITHWKVNFTIIIIVMVTTIELTIYHFHYHHFYSYYDYYYYCVKQAVYILPPHPQPPLSIHPTIPVLCRRQFAMQYTYFMPKWYEIMKSHNWYHHNSHPTRTKNVIVITFVCCAKHFQLIW